MSFREAKPNELDFNPFEKIGEEWFLVTAGNESGYNTMTASWGFAGVMWAKNMFITVIRPCRHTYGFAEKEEYFTACFFDEDKKPALSYCGSHSGRDVNKAKATGLTPAFIDGTTAFEEAKLIFICKKSYSQQLDNDLLLPSLQNMNSSEPIHKMFIGEIIKVLVKE